MKTVRVGSLSQSKTSFSRLTVNDAMRRRVVCLSPEATIEEVIARFIKHKVNAILVVDENELPLGVVSKTEVLGAYYASIPIDFPVGDIMGTPAFTCFPDDSLEYGLATMQERKVHRLYVIDRETTKAVGVLAYPDIVGLLYRFCCKCEYSRHSSRKNRSEEKSTPKIVVGDLMNSQVQNGFLEDTLIDVIEKISLHKLGALLITNSNKVPRGVISKTDLTLAYKRGISLDTTARLIMSSPVASCAEEEMLEDGIHRMIFSEINRLFIYRESPSDIVGVLSLTDAAHVRSGSCQACSVSRFSL